MHEYRGIGMHEGGGIKAYLVDLDGTLADTAEASHYAYSRALAECGAAVNRATFDREAVSHTRFNEALVMLLRQLRCSGAQLALVTTASAANVAALLAGRPDITALFSLLVTGDDVSRHKPDPEAYSLAARRLGLEPHECLVIEDSDIGLAAGRAFGAAVLRVNMGGLRP